MRTSPVGLIEIRDLLQTCAGEFRKYEATHRAKVPELDGLIRSGPLEVLKQAEARRADTLAKAEVNRVMAESCEGMLTRLPTRSEIVLIDPDRLVLGAYYEGHTCQFEASPEPGMHFEALGYLAEQFHETIKDIVERKNFSPNPNRRRPARV